MTSEQPRTEAGRRILDDPVAIAPGARDWVRQRILEAEAPYLTIALAEAQIRIRSLERNLHRTVLCWIAVAVCWVALATLYLIGGRL